MCKRRLIVVRHQQLAKAGMRCQCEGRSNSAGGMREINVSSLSEMHVMEDENHAGYSHANRGKNMGRERSGYKSG